MFQVLSCIVYTQYIFAFPTMFAKWQSLDVDRKASVAMCDLVDLLRVMWLCGFVL